MTCRTPSTGPTQARLTPSPPLDHGADAPRAPHPAQVEGPSLTPATWPAGQVAFTVRQVAEILGMTEKAIYHRAARGQIPGKFYVGKSLRFRRADLLRSIAEGRGLSPTRSR